MLLRLGRTGEEDGVMTGRERGWYADRKGSFHSEL